MNRELREAYRAYLMEPDNKFALDNYARLLSRSGEERYAGFLLFWNDWGDGDYTFDSWEEFHYLYHNRPGTFPLKKTFSPILMSNYYYYLAKDNADYRDLHPEDYNNLIFDSFFHGPVGLQAVIVEEGFDEYGQWTRNIVDRFGVSKQDLFEEPEEGRLPVDRGGRQWQRRSAVGPRPMVGRPGEHRRIDRANVMAALYFGLIEPDGENFVEFEVPAP